MIRFVSGVGIGLVCYGLLAAQTPAIQDEVKKNLEELKKLQGVWKVVKCQAEDAKHAEAVVKSAKMIFEGDRVTVMDGDKVKGKGTFKIDAAKKPKTMDITDTDGPAKGQSQEAIYSFDGETLRICGGGKERPNDFTVPPKSGRMVLELQKVKK